MPCALILNPKTSLVKREASFARYDTRLTQRRHDYVFNHDDFSLSCSFL